MIDEHLQGRQLTVKSFRGSGSLKNISRDSTRLRVSFIMLHEGGNRFRREKVLEKLSPRIIISFSDSCNNARVRSDRRGGVHISQIYRRLVY